MDLSLFGSEDFDVYVELGEILSEPQSLGTTLQTLQRSLRDLERNVADSIEQNQRNISEYLGNLKEAEELLVDYKSVVQELRKELAQSKETLLSKKNDMLSIWLRSVYFKRIVKSLEELQGLVLTFGSINSLFRDKMFSKAASLIHSTIEEIDNYEFGFLPVCQRLKESFQNKTKELSQSVLEEIRELLFMKKGSQESEFKRYAVLGTLNVKYILRQEEDKEVTELVESLTSMLEALSSINSLASIPKLIDEREEKLIENLFKTCFSQMPTLNYEDPKGLRDFSLKALLPNEQAREMALKIVNQMFAVSALVMRNHLSLLSELDKFSVGLNLQPLWKTLQKQILEVFQTIINITGKNSFLGDPESIQDTRYMTLLSSVIPLTPYHYPFLYNRMSLYVKDLMEGVRTGDFRGQILNLALEKKLFNFLEVLKDDCQRLFTLCVTSSDAFRYNKAQECRFVCTQTFCANLKALEQFKQHLPEQHHTQLLDSVVMMLGLFIKESQTIFEKHTETTGYNILFLEEPQVVEDLRSETSFKKVSLESLASTPFVSSLFKAPKTSGLLQEREGYHLYFQTSLQNPFIAEAAKLTFICALNLNLKFVFEELVSFFSDFLDFVPEIVETPQKPKTETEPKRSKLSKFTSKLKFGKKKKSTPAQQEETQSESIYSVLNHNLLKLLELHDKSVFLLKGEIRMRIFYFLYNLKGNNYWREEPNVEAEWFIKQLCKELVSVHLAIKPVLKPEQLEYVWEGAFEIIQQMMIEGLKHINDMVFSKQGLAIFQKNLKVLQSELSLLEIPEHPQKEPLSKIQEFFELLQMNEKTLVRFIKENPSLFPYKHWQILMVLKTPSRPYAVLPQSQQTINEILTSDLK